MNAVLRLTKHRVAEMTKEATNLTCCVIMVHMQRIFLTEPGVIRYSANSALPALHLEEPEVRLLCNAVLVFQPSTAALSLQLGRLNFRQTAAASISSLLGMSGPIGPYVLSNALSVGLIPRFATLVYTFSTIVLMAIRRMAM